MCICIYESFPSDKKDEFVSEVSSEDRRERSNDRDYLEIFVKTVSLPVLISDSSETHKVKNKNVVTRR